MAISLSVWSPALAASDEVAEAAHASRAASRATSQALSLDEVLRNLDIRRGSELRLHAEGEKPYPQGSGFEPYHYLGSLALMLDVSDDLDAIAARLAPDEPSRKAELLSLLKRRLAAGGGTAKIAFQELLPDFARRSLNTFADQDGPNCWNTSRNFHCPWEGRRYTHRRIMTEYLDRDYRELGKGDTLEYGDVVAFWDGDRNRDKSALLLHTAVYLGNGVFFHKGSRSKTSPYVFERFDSIADFYSPYPALTITVHEFTPGPQTKTVIQPLPNESHLELTASLRRTGRKVSKLAESLFKKPLPSPMPASPRPAKNTPLQTP